MLHTVRFSVSHSFYGSGAGDMKMDCQRSICHFIPFLVHRSDIYNGNIGSIRFQRVFFGVQQQFCRRACGYHRVLTYFFFVFICRHPQHPFFIGNLPGKFIQRVLLFSPKGPSVQKQFRVIAIGESPYIHHLILFFRQIPAREQMNHFLLTPLCFQVIGPVLEEAAQVNHPIA